MLCFPHSSRCATTFLFFFSRRISGMTFNQPCREVRRMVPPQQRFIEGNTVRSFTFSLVVNKHTGLGPPLKGRTGVLGAHSSSSASIGSPSGDGQRRWGKEPAWGQLHVSLCMKCPVRSVGEVHCHQHPALHMAPAQLLSIPVPSSIHGRLLKH